MGVKIEKYVYHKSKLVAISDILRECVRTASSMFSTEDERNDALNKIMEINLAFERILENE